MPNAKQNLVIVESPSKAKTIGKYLGPDYQVKASMGHLRDLPKSTLSVDIEHDFEPEYQPLKGKEEIIADLRKAAKGSGRIYLATDPDREGEAISWHLKELLSIPDEETLPRDLQRDYEQRGAGVHPGARVPSTRSRRRPAGAPDARPHRRLSAQPASLEKDPQGPVCGGRVQSVATRLVVDRENEIRTFVPQEYWTLDVV